MKTIIHINQNVIKQNTKNKTNNPVITCKTYKENIYTNEVIIYGQDGLEAARIKHSPLKPLNCGARVWIESFNKIETL